MNKGKVAGKAPMVKEVEGTIHWCACGESANQPFCDGSHKGGEFSPVEVNFETKTKVAFCLCKQTDNRPFCDGTHKSL